ncbi:MAG: hypothetical protein GY810_13380 [Aureispira sp.]|nr:hypothetical protein [Aureispira sp.]
MSYLIQLLKSFKIILIFPLLFLAYLGVLFTVGGLEGLIKGNVAFHKSLLVTVGGLALFIAVLITIRFLFKR